MTYTNPMGENMMSRSRQMHRPRMEKSWGSNPINDRYALANAARLHIPVNKPVVDEYIRTVSKFQNSLDDLKQEIDYIKREVVAIRKEISEEVQEIQDMPIADIKERFCCKLG